MYNYYKDQQLENKRKEEIRQNTINKKIKEKFEHNQEELLNKYDAKVKEFVIDVRIIIYNIET